MEHHTQEKIYKKITYNRPQQKYANDSAQSNLETILMHLESYMKKDDCLFPHSYKYLRPAL